MTSTPPPRVFEAGNPVGETPATEAGFINIVKQPNSRAYEPTNKVRLPVSFVGREQQQWSRFKNGNPFHDFRIEQRRKPEKIPASGHITFFFFFLFSLPCALLLLLALHYLQGK